jgi:hypothetical protein
MSRLLQWVLGICAVLVTAALIFSAALPLFAPRLGLAGDGWTMGPGRMFGRGWAGPGHMFGGMTGGFGLPFFGFGGFFGPLLFLGLLALGVFLLVRGASRPAPGQPPAPSQAPVAATPCANCGRPLQPEWVACPYCGERVIRNA